ncbi:MAG: ribonuclease III [Armatimonadetes bacterium]|nr:ribonuclease III [Armatimonadota bacterium]NIM23679.1 ribonuclease III [Armatimonadota bacterium]NIM67550.1 ribonuclease III [Armatimonadota bacterium]NIM76067.1 ribonuclease III [Armatimonadota bacterium]NIN05737.1 ribonuclease III [Armatimonadota bacterium]
MKKKLRKLEERLGCSLKDQELLIRALTHSSAAEGSTEESNERLEFLGDAVLGVVVSEYLHSQFSTWSEGELTQAKAVLVSEPTLAAAARRLGLGEVLRLSRGEAQSGGRERPSILCDAFEALIAAVYLETGFEKVRECILRWLAEPIESVALGEYSKDYKTLLQELLQEEHRALPAYRVLEESGPDHNKTFVVEVHLGKKMLGVGAGKSKKEAERSAARQALERHRNAEA